MSLQATEQGRAAECRGGALRWFRPVDSSGFTHQSSPTSGQQGSRARTSALAAAAVMTCTLPAPRVAFGGRGRRSSETP